MKMIKTLAVAVSLLAAGAAQAAVTIDARSTTPTLIGTFGPGTFQFTTTGIVSLQGPIGSGFDLDANGVPQPGSVSDPASTPNGSDTADGNFGPAGQGINFGALAGTESASGGNFFLLGTSSRLTFTSTTSVFGLVNDSFSSNNDGAFTVSVAAVPEPATWGMMILGFGMVGGAMRSARRQPKVTYASA
jgi:hypothetical protein